MDSIKGLTLAQQVQMKSELIRFHEEQFKLCSYPEQKQYHKLKSDLAKVELDWIISK